MKKITFLFFFLVASLGYSQVVLEDFESMYPGGDLNNFEGASSASVVADPAPGGTNGNVLEIISEASGNPWQGASMLLQNNYVDLTGANPEIQLDIYSTSSFGMLVAVENPSGTSPRSAGDDDTNVDYVGGSGWQTITITLNQGLDTTGTANGEYELLAFFPGWNNATDGWVTGAPGSGVANTIYIDNIRGIAGSSLGGPTCNDGMQNGDETGVDCGGSCPNACPTPPTTGAPAPPSRDAADVLSLYSGAYANTTIETYDAGFCGFGGSTEVTIAGNPTYLYSGVPCVGWEFTNNRIDASTFSHVHFDFYTDDTDLIGKVFNVKFSDWAGTGAEVTALEININDGTTPAIATGTWVSVDLEINFTNPIFAGSATRSDLAQFVITSNLSNVWYDNVYFHRNTLGTDDLTATEFKAFPNPTTGSWNIIGNNIIKSISVYDVLGKQVVTLTPNALETEIDGSTLTQGLYFARIEGENGSETVKLIKE